MPPSSPSGITALVGFFEVAEAKLNIGRYEYENKLKLYEKKRKLDNILLEINDEKLKEELRELI